MTLERQPALKDRSLVKNSIGYLLTEFHRTFVSIQPAIITLVSARSLRDPRVIARVEEILDQMLALARTLAQILPADGHVEADAVANGSLHYTKKHLVGELATVAYSMLPGLAVVGACLLYRPAFVVDAWPLFVIIFAGLSGGTLATLGARHQPRG